MIGNRGRENLAASDEALRRLFERCLLVTLIGVVVWVLVDKARDVRSAAELSAFRQSSGALRVALVLERTRAAMAMRPANDSATPTNPFLLLERLPGGYAGDVLLADAEAGRVAPGAWFFDTRCPCVGYRPQDEGRFHAASGRGVMVFPLSSNLLSAREPYRWRGEIVDYPESFVRQMRSLGNC